MNTNERQMMKEAQQLIKDKRYDQARVLLMNVDHPKAKDWLDKLDQIAPKRKNADLYGFGSASEAALAANNTSKDIYNSDDVVASTPLDDPASQMDPATAMEFGSRGTRASSITTGDGTAKSGAVLMVLIVTLISSIVVGAALMFSSQYFYLLLIQPGFAAFLVALVVTLAIKQGKVRNAGIGLMAAVVAVVGLYGSYRYFTYVDFRLFAASDIQQAEPSLTNSEVRFVIDQFLLEETGSSGFLGFIRLEAAEGMTISRATSVGGSGLGLNEFFTVGYWILEILFIGFILLAMVSGATNAPFCTDEDKWLRYNTTGYVKREDSETFFNALQAGNINAAAAVMQRNGGQFEVKVAQCSDHASDAMFKVYMKAGRNSQDVVKPTVIPNEVAKMLRAQ